MMLDLVALLKSVYIQLSPSLSCYNFIILQPISMLLEPLACSLHSESIGTSNLE